MLELPEIKGGDFEETLDRLKKQIPSLCPEWCDLSESSPGVMLLELLTYISLEQCSSMNKIGGGALINLGRLIGFTPQRLSPAAATAVLPAAAPKGEKLKVGSLVFETTRDFSPCGSRAVMFGRCNENGGIATLCRVNEKTPPQRMFADSDSFVIGFDKPLEAGKNISLYLCLDPQGRTLPNGLSEAPWGSPLRWQYYTVGGWRDVQLISDETLSCLQSGFLTFRVGSHAELDGVYPIRAVADRSRFDLMPLLNGAYTDACPVRQTDTKCDSVTFDINSFQSNRMVFSNALAENGVFKLFVNSAMGWCNAEDMNIAFDVVREQEGFRLATSSRKDLAALFSELDGSEVLMLVMYEQEFVREFTQFYSDGSANQRIPLNFSGAFAPETGLMAAQEQDGVLYWHRWSWSDKLPLQPPECRCFSIDPADGSLVFGDKIHGAIPAACGRKSIMLTSLRLTSGADGNISSCRAESAAGNAELITPAQDGRDRETPDSFFARVLKAPKPGTLLTLADYEQAAMQTAGVLLNSAQAYCTKDRSGKVVPNAVTLLTEPLTGRTDHSLAGLEWVKDAVQRHIEELRTINTRVTVKFPKYIPMSAALSFDGTGFSSDAERDAEACIRRYFDENRGGEIDSARLTKLLTALPCVSAVRSLELSEPAMGGRFSVPEGSRVYLKSCEIYCTNRR